MGFRANSFTLEGFADVFRPPNALCQVVEKNICVMRPDISFIVQTMEILHVVFFSTFNSTASAELDFAERYASASSKHCYAAELNFFEPNETKRQFG